MDRGAEAARAAQNGHKALVVSNGVAITGHADSGSRRFVPTPSCPWPLLSKRQCELESPSQRQGLPYDKELKQLRTVADLITKTAQKLGLSFSNATAQLFMHRYYAAKSLQRNDRFIMACACLFLAAKVEDEPRALVDVAVQCWKIRWANDRISLQRYRDEGVLEKLKDSILTAERALLYALGFKFRIDHPFLFISSTLLRFAELPGPEGDVWRAYRRTKEHVGQTYNFINDLLPRTKLVLRYDLRVLGAAAIHIGLSLPGFHAVHSNVPTVEGKPWYVMAFTPPKRTEAWATPASDVPDLDVTLDLLQDIAGEIVDLYTVKGKPKASVPVAQLAGPSAPAAHAEGPSPVTSPVTPPIEPGAIPTTSQEEHPNSLAQEAGEGDGGSQPAPGASAVPRAPASGAGAGRALNPHASDFVPIKQEEQQQVQPPVPAPDPAHAAAAQQAGVAGRQSPKRTADAAGLCNSEQLPVKHTALKSEDVSAPATHASTGSDEVPLPVKQEHPLVKEEPQQQPGGSPQHPEGGSLPNGDLQSDVKAEAVEAEPMIAEAGKSEAVEGNAASAGE